MRVVYYVQTAALCAYRETPGAENHASANLSHYVKNVKCRVFGMPPGVTPKTAVAQLRLHCGLPRTNLNLRVLRIAAPKL